MPRNGGTDIAALPGLTDTERTALRARYPTVESLHEQVARSGMTPLAGVDAERLRHALARYELRHADDRHPRAGRVLTFLRANWLEAILMALVVGIGGLAVRAVRRPERVMVATRSLSPFQVLDTGDVRQERTWGADFGTFADTGKVIGRFPLALIPKGEPVRAERLSRIRFEPATELRGRRILLLPVAKRALPLAVAGTHAALLLSPRGGDGAAPSAAIEDVIVLNATDAGDTSTVAVAVLERDLPTVTRLLGTSEVILTQRVAAPAPPPDTAKASSPARP